MTTIDQVQASAPDLEEARAQSQQLIERLTGAGDRSAALDCIRSWDGLRRDVATWQALVGLRFNQDTTDAEARAAREQRDRILPQWTEIEVDVKRALLAHPLRPQLEAEIGPQAFALWEAEVLAFDPAIKDSLERESALGASYTELLAGAELDVRGETYNLSTIIKLEKDADRDLRHAGARAKWAWFAEHGAELDRIFGDLVHLRSDMASLLGYDDFVGLGYKRMQRIDYTREDVERFRGEVRRHVVPLAQELYQRRGADLGLDRLMAWDEGVSDPGGSPAPKGDHDWMVARAQEMFDQMGSELGSFFRRMHEGGFLDLKSRPGKAGGGFCTGFPSYGMPFVFANFNGTKGDVEVLTHEIGHAFQSFQSRDRSPIDYMWPTLESCEIHSMSLEFLTWPHMERFFEEDADRFRRSHLVEGLTFLPYGAAVDHYQHEVYANPGMTAAERHGVWREMERTYLPWRDWGDLEYPAAGGRWQAQRHIYLRPFYYIDYVLAQTCAFQFWLRAEREPDEALQAYVALCKRGGEAPFQELARSAGLTSPFDEGCLEAVVERARATLD